jgi:phosphoenolpyruvate carboxykinase (ATP)
MHSLRPFDVEYLTNPSHDDLVELALAHTPCMFKTGHGNLMKVSRNKARMAKYTYIIADDSQAENFSHKVMPREQAQELIDYQRSYIESFEKIIEVRGTLGIGKRAVPTQWLYTLEGANIAGMQSHMTFVVDDDDFEPTFQIIYTPDIRLHNTPGDQAILVDLENYRTYIMGPDYFGESKKAALRMLNEYVYHRGGLVMHAGAKLIEKDGRRMTMTVMGLSGTGKTTTTFSEQGDLTQPIQDDMVAIWPGGEVSATEAGCFAKTFGLTYESEPVIYRGTLDPVAWVENTFLDEIGRFDFHKTHMTKFDVHRYEQTLVETGADPQKIYKFLQGTVSRNDVINESGVLEDDWEFIDWTQNGRSVIPMSAIKNFADLSSIPPVTSMGILNRDEGPDAATPGIVRFTSPEQATAYFMLGETTKTSAAGKDVGKIRSPFTQPFFPRKLGLQADRFFELAGSMSELCLWMMNTGYVAGSAGSGTKIKIRHSSAMLEALIADRIMWKLDPDFGYEVVDIAHPDNHQLLRQVPAKILNPSTVMDAVLYCSWVDRMKQERRAFLESYDVSPTIIAAI